MITRRETLVATLAALVAGKAGATENPSSVLILAPSNLGLRRNEDGSEPGTWRAPEILLEQGLASRVRAGGVWRLGRPLYVDQAQQGSRIRNGPAIRAFSLELAALVSRAVRKGLFPIVIGGDCSILLGCLYGARQFGRTGLIHIDGHSDFLRPGNDGASTALSSAAGADLALAVGHGEALLTRWPQIDGPLVNDDDTAQIGERNALDPDFNKYYGDILTTRITRVLIQDVQRDGLQTTVERIANWIEGRGLKRIWLHVDLDVLDERDLPAVNFPGSPGLSYDDLSALIVGLRRTGTVFGVDFSIYDPDRDPKRIYAPRIVDCIGVSLGQA